METTPTPPPGEAGPTPTEKKKKFVPKGPSSANTPTWGKLLPGSLKYIKRGQENQSPHHKSVMAFGSSLRLISHEHLLTEFAPLGFTKQSLARLFRALKIPSFHIGPHRFVDAYTFYLIMHAILRPGEPDFIAPCANAMRSKLRKSIKARVSITTEFAQDAIPTAARDLIYCRHLLEPKLTTVAISNTARDAAQRLREFTENIPLAQVITRFRTGADAYWLKRISTPGDPPDPLDTPATIPPCPATSTEPSTSSPSKDSVQRARTRGLIRRSSSRPSLPTPATPTPTSPSEEPPSSGKSPRTPSPSPAN